MTTERTVNNQGYREYVSKILIHFNHKVGDVRK
jgi:hypothetical protein